MIDRQQFTEMGKWAGFMGIITIIGGALSCLSIVGIIPGIISIILGLKLRNAKQYAQEAASGLDDAGQSSRTNRMVTELSSYFKIQSILVIISLVLAVIGIIIAIVVGITAGSYFSNYDWSY